MLSRLIRAADFFLSKEGTLFRYSLSFGILFGTFPGILIFVMIIQKSYLSVHQLVDVSVLFLPEELIVPFIDYLLVRNETSFLAGLFSFITALLVCSQSIYAFLLIVEEKEKIEIPGFYLRVRSVFLLLGYLFLFFILATVFFFFSVNYWVIYILLVVFLYVFYRSLSFYVYRANVFLLESIITGFLIEGTGVVFFEVMEQFTSTPSVYGPMSSIMFLFFFSSVLGNLLFWGYCLSLDSSKIIKKEKYIFAKTKMGMVLQRCFKLK